MAVRSHRAVLIDRLGTQVFRPLVLVIGIVAGLMLAGCGSTQPSQLPVPLEDIMPSYWTLMPSSNDNPNPAAVNIDSDEESEWMVLFYYDNPAEGGNGPIGGIIYDSQQNTEPYDPSVVVPFPYQPSAFLVPYRLLPDWRAGKGQGYLGDVGVTWEQVRTAAPEPRYDELVMWGQRGGINTRLSVFVWQGVTNGYQVAHFAGSQEVKTPGRESGNQVREVTTLERFNKRTNLCSQVEYVRQGDSLDFVASEPAVVFCLGRPAVPTYPEAVVVAWLLSPDGELVFNGQPTTPDSDRDAIRDQIESQLRTLFPQPPRRIVSVAYEGVARTQGVGNSAESTIEVVTTVETAAGELATYRWRLIEVRPGTSKETSRWRILSVQPGS